MTYRDDEGREKEENAVSEEALGEILEKDEDEDDDLAPGELLDDEKAWE